MSIQLEHGLSAEQLSRRRFSIGGSDANILMGGDDAAILALWEQKTGRKEPEDLSWVLPVQIGVQTEPLNVRFFEHAMSAKVDREHLECIGDPEWRTATLDGRLLDHIFEAKHVNQFSKIDEVVQRYMAQLHHNMDCAGVKKSWLSVFIGTFTHEIIEVEYDDFYGSLLLDRETEFWACVQEDRAPGSMPEIEAPKVPTALREVDMEGSNEWASHAADWLASKGPANTFKKADKELKSLMEDDMGLAYGHGIQIKRAKNGSLRIGEVK